MLSQLRHVQFITKWFVQYGDPNKRYWANQIADNLKKPLPQLETSDVFFVLGGLVIVAMVLIFILRSVNKK
jgi:hypothetical protein